VNEWADLMGRGMDARLAVVVEDSAPLPIDPASKARLQA
jgi:hypothetical protein